MPDIASAPQFANRTAVLATMHGKEQVIAPLLAELGITVILPPEFDTDRFGTFSREVKRAGNQLEAARIKATEAMQLTGCSLAIASEGAFGPHPALPYLPCNRELVLLIDHEQSREPPLEILGEAVSTTTNFAQAQVSSLAEALEFAQTAAFPEHGLMLRLAEQWIKGITTEAELIRIVESALVSSPSVTLETDMRACYNPKRMQVIRQATENLVQKIRQTCPHCGWPGFDIRERQSGLPCAWCGQPTELTQAVIYGCHRCDHQQVESSAASQADPAYCAYCNP